MDKGKKLKIGWVRREHPRPLRSSPKIYPVPREWAERFFNVQRWTEMPSGGQFAALEEPKCLAEDIREFFQPLRRSRR
jgi:hypothetical protein